MGLVAVNNTPSTNPVQLSDIKTQLRIVNDLSDPVTNAPYSSDDAALQTYIDSAFEYVERETRQQLCTQNYTLTLDSFPGRGHFEHRHPLRFDERGRQTILLPKPPLQRVSAIQYSDPTSVLRTVDPSSYIVDATQRPGRIVLRPGYSWPATDNSAGCVQITYTAGYGDATAAPSILKQAILLLAGSWYEFREDTIALRINSIPIGVQNIIYQNMFPEAV